MIGLPSFNLMAGMNFNLVNLTHDNFDTLDIHGKRIHGQHLEIFKAAALCI